MAQDDRSILIAHKMEQRANVYLYLQPSGKWVVDSVFLQAGPVDGLDEVDPNGCACDDYSSDEHKRAREIAAEVEMPTPVELLRLMLDAMFPLDIPPDLTDRATIEEWLDSRPNPPVQL